MVSAAYGLTNTANTELWNQCDTLHTAHAHLTIFILYYILSLSLSIMTKQH